MANVFDVAKYILQKTGPISAMKLQKLVYYSQAWSLVWDDKPLFDEGIEAWAMGPVVPDLYQVHKGAFAVNESMFIGNIGTISKEGMETIDVIIKEYGSKSSQWLSDLTHEEAPWKNARLGLDPGERGCSEITKAAMAEYYSSL